MFEIINLPKSPAIARKLMELNNVGVVAADEAIANLAKKDIISTNNFNNLFFELSEKQLHTVQQIKDRNSRCTLIQDDSSLFCDVVFSYLQIENLFPSILVLSFVHLKEIEKKFVEFFPDKKYASLSLEQNKEEIEKDVDFYFLSFDYFKDNIINMLQQKNFSQIITNVSSLTKDDTVKKILSVSKIHAKFMAVYNIEYFFNFNNKKKLLLEKEKMFNNLSSGEIQNILVFNSYLFSEYYSLLNVYLSYSSEKRKELEKAMLSLFNIITSLVA